MVVLQFAGQPRRMPLTRLARDWRGELVTLWRPPPGYREGQVVADDGSPLARWVTERLLPLDASPGRPIGERVRAFQRAQGLVQDGIAGPQTLMALSRASDVGVPRLLSP
jgi:general secretion pathway protein A